MTLKKQIIAFCKNVPQFYLLFLITKKVRADFLARRYNDEELIAKTYKKVMGVDLNLENPLRFTEKIQWLKLNYNNPKLYTYSDKFAVRQYITEKGYGNMLTEIIGIYKSANEISLCELPDKFVLKTTHSSGWNLICLDKTKWSKNWFWWKKILNFWLNDDYSKYYQESHYKNIEPQILCEKFMGDSKLGLNDYKFFCFNGTVKLIQVDVERYSNHKQNFYDENWNFIPTHAGYESYSDHSKFKPKRLEEMKEMSESLSKEFLHVRVDLFEWNDKIYFGEFTFFDGSGYYKTEPEEFDFTMGQWLQLPTDKTIK